MRLFPRFFLLALLGLSGLSAYAQSNASGQSGNAIVTAVPFLGIAPNSGASGMGDLGVATAPDVNSAYWNPGKLAFVQEKGGAAISYNPWMRQIVNDVFLVNLPTYYKLNERQAVGLSMTYFDYGSIDFTDMNGEITQQFNPREFSLDGTFSMQLSERFAMGLSGRYIYSNLAGQFNVPGGNATSSPAHAFAFDLGAYWRNKDLTVADLPATLALGATLSNVGGKMDYRSGNKKDFLPTNLRIGTALTTELDAYNKLTVALEAGKLLVPSDSANMDKSTFGGMFSSLAEDPIKETMQEVQWSVGVEYAYNNLLMLRAGYFHESPQKGDRQYFTLGAGLRYHTFGLDVSYLMANKRNHPLENTLRFTLLFNFGGQQAGGSQKTGAPSTGLGNEI